MRAIGDVCISVDFTIPPTIALVFSIPAPHHVLLMLLKVFVFVKYSLRDVMAINSFGS